MTRRRRGRRTDSATNGSRRQGFIHDDRDVADDGGITRQRLRPQVVAGGEPRERFRIDFADVDLFAGEQPARVADGRCELADDAERDMPRAYVRRTAAHQVVARLLATVASDDPNTGRAARRCPSHRRNRPARTAADQCGGVAAPIHANADRSSFTLRLKRLPISNS